MIFYSVFGFLFFSAVFSVFGNSFVSRLFFCSFLLLLIFMYFTYACIFTKSVEFLRMPRELSKNSPLARPFLAACEMEQIVEPTACCWRFESDCWGEADRSCRFQRILFRFLKCFFLTLLIFSLFFFLFLPLCPTRFCSIHSDYMPVLRVFQCERCRIRIRDHCSAWSGALPISHHIWSVVLLFRNLYVFYVQVHTVRKDHTLY